MRNNRMMRAASALLVAVLLTTSTISGTFAKYVTEKEVSDTARVAKWGVEIDAELNGKRGEEIMISTPNSKVKVFVIPTNEELMIARDTLAIVNAK